MTTIFESETFVHLDHVGDEEGPDRHTGTRHNGLSNRDGNLLRLPEPVYHVHFRTRVTDRVHSGDTYHHRT